MPMVELEALAAAGEAAAMAGQEGAVGFLEEWAARQVEQLAAKEDLAAAVELLAEVLAQLLWVVLAVSYCFGLRGTNHEKSMDRKQRNTRHCSRQSG
jgi:hypothetical protein